MQSSFVRYAALAALFLGTPGWAIFEDVVLKTPQGQALEKVARAMQRRGPLTGNFSLSFGGMPGSRELRLGLPPGELVSASLGAEAKLNCTAILPRIEEAVLATNGFTVLRETAAGRVVRLLWQGIPRSLLQDYTTSDIGRYLRQLQVEVQNQTELYVQIDFSVVGFGDDEIVESVDLTAWRPGRLFGWRKFMSESAF